MASAIKRHWSIASIFLVAAVGPLNYVSAAKRSPTPDLTLSAALAADPNEQRGKNIFERRCAQCHQKDAQGMAARQIPALAGQQYELFTLQVCE